MNLFSEKKNRYFTCCQELINMSMLKNGLTLNEIKHIVSKQGFNEYDYDFAQALVGNTNTAFSDIQLFYKEDNKYVPIVNKPVALLLSTIEKQWMSEMLQQQGIGAFINSELMEKLQKYLEGPDTKSELPKVLFASDGCFDKTICHNMALILQAFRSNSYILCNNYSLGGTLYSNVRIIPYKIEFSSKLEGFWLIGYDLGLKFFLKAALKRLEIIDIISRDDDYDIDEISREFYNKKSVKLEIKDIKGSVERALYVFSEYKRDSIFDKKRNVHIIEIEYYEFDEYDILKTIYSLGANVQVVSPEHVRLKVADSIRNQLDLFIEYC